MQSAIEQGKERVEQHQDIHKVIRRLHDILGANVCKSQESIENTQFAISERQINVTCILKLSAGFKQGLPIQTAINKELKDCGVETQKLEKLKLCHNVRTKSLAAALQLAQDLQQQASHDDRDNVRTKTPAAALQLAQICNSKRMTMRLSWSKGRSFQATCVTAITLPRSLDAI